MSEAKSAGTLGETLAFEGGFTIVERTLIDIGRDEVVRDLRHILDLRRVSFLDSDGLRLALDLHAAASGDGFELELVPGPPHVQRVFEVTGTLDALPFVSTQR